MTRSLAFCLSIVIATSLIAAEPENIVYDFSATWCGPCQQMAPLVARLEREGLRIRKVDIDKEKALADRFGISSIPTFVVVANGKELHRQSGAMTETDLRKLVAKLPDASGPIVADIGNSPEISLGESAEMSGGNNLVIRGNDTETAVAASTTPQETLSADPMASSVRIRVTVAGKVNLGSGTIIASTQGMCKILTCAHIFRGFNDDSKIEVDLIIDNEEQPYIARLDGFNEEADLGLITVATSKVLPVAAIAKVDQAPSQGNPVVSIGCSGGDNPTRENLQITAIDKYNGPHNVECTGLPVRGRSGGGLFNNQGEVVGVCIAADKENHRGLYSGLFAIHSILTENGLAGLFEAPAIPSQNSNSSTGEATLLASTTPTPQPFPNSAAAWNADVASSPVENVLPAATHSAGASAVVPTQPIVHDPVDLKTGRAEVVVIIRDADRPEQENRVVIIHDASPKFISYLNGELDGNFSGPGISLSQHSPAPAMPRTLRATAKQTLPVAHSMSRQLLNSTDQPQLQPTSLMQQAAPRRYVRSKASASQN